MKDLIDERDEKEKIQRSIIKRWNVHYITQEELEEEKAKNDSLKQAEEILARLRAEELEDEAKKQAEIEAARKQSEDNYNATTNSYSGLYGQSEMDSVTKGQIEQILGEKDAHLRSVIDEQVALDSQKENLP